jgi:hypothetical protein
MFTRFSLGYRGQKIPTHGVLAPVAILFAFVILILFSLVIDTINWFETKSRLSRTTARDLKA